MIEPMNCPRCGKEVNKITYIDSTGKRRKTRYIRMCNEDKWTGVRYTPIKHIYVSSKARIIADIKWNVACRRELRRMKKEE